MIRLTERTPQEKEMVQPGQILRKKGLYRDLCRTPRFSPAMRYGQIWRTAYISAQNSSPCRTAGAAVLCGSACDVLRRRVCLDDGTLQNFTRSATYAATRSMGMRICSMLSRSRIVTQLSAGVLSSPTVWKSTVMQKGVPISSSRR